MEVVVEKQSAPQIAGIQKKETKKKSGRPRRKLSCMEPRLRPLAASQHLVVVGSPTPCRHRSAQVSTTTTGPSELRQGSLQLVEKRVPWGGSMPLLPGFFVHVLDQISGWRFLVHWSSF
jgi:hypothetical protein